MGLQYGGRTHNADRTFHRFSYGPGFVTTKRQQKTLPRGQCHRKAFTWTRPNDFSFAASSELNPGPGATPLKSNSSGPITRNNRATFLKTGYLQVDSAECLNQVVIFCAFSSTD